MNILKRPTPTDSLDNCCPQHHGHRLRSQFTQAEMTDLANVTDYLGLELYYWPLQPADVAYVVVERSILIPEALDYPERRWAIALAIAHWTFSPPANEYVEPLSPLRKATLCYQSRSFAFHLLVDQEEADRLGLDSKEISERYGIPRDKVEMYRHEWPIHGIKEG